MVRIRCWHVHTDRFGVPDTRRTFRKVRLPPSNHRNCPCFCFAAVRNGDRVFFRRENLPNTSCMFCKVWSDLPNTADKEVAHISVGLPVRRLCPTRFAPSVPVRKYPHNGQGSRELAGVPPSGRVPPLPCAGQDRETARFLPYLGRHFVGQSTPHYKSVR